MVGVGPGDPDLVTSATTKAIQRADLVVGWRLSLDLVEPLLKGKEVYVEEVSNYPDVVRKAAKRCLQEEKTTVVLTTGDPCVSAALEEILGAFNGATSHVIPGISSVQVAAARVGISLEESTLVSFHKLGDVQAKLDWLRGSLKGGRHVIALVDEEYPPSWIARQLTSMGIPGSTVAYVCQNLSLPQESISKGTLQDFSRLEFDPLSVLVVLAARRD